MSHGVCLGAERLYHALPIVVTFCIRRAAGENKEQWMLRNPIPVSDHSNKMKGVRKQEIVGSVISLCSRSMDICHY